MYRQIHGVCGPGEQCNSMEVAGRYKFVMLKDKFHIIKCLCFQGTVK